MTKLLFDFFLGGMAVAAVWAIVALLLIRLFRLDDPRGQAIVLAIALVAGFVGRARLVPDFEWMVVAGSVSLALLLLLRDVIVYRRSMREMRGACIKDVRVEAIAESLAARFSIRTPSLLISATASQPCTSGVVNPVIILPAKLADSLTDRELSALLAHEMAHIRRRDFVSKWALLLLTRMSWLNPVATGLYRRIGLELECASDKLAARVTGLPGTLARTLVKTNMLIKAEAANRTDYLMVGACSSLESRVVSLARKSESQRTWMLKIGAILLAMWPTCFQIAPLWLKLTS